MAATELDALVVSLRADDSRLKRDLERVHRALADLDAAAGGTDRALADLIAAGQQTTDLLAATADQAASRMSSAFERFARTGKLSFSDLRDVAVAALNDIVNSAVRAGLDQLFGGGGGGGFGGGGGGLGGFFSGLFGSRFPGRATGGPVAPGRAYMVGERGPELFVPAVSGRVLPSGTQPPARVVNIAVNVTAPGEPAALRRSAGQIAAGVQRALARAERNL